MSSQLKTEAVGKTVPVSMRVEQSKKNLIDMAASMLGSDRTSFIVDAAYKYAEQVILDKRVFVLDQHAFEAFEGVLNDNPFEDNQCVQKLMSRPKRWG